MSNQEIALTISPETLAEYKLLREGYGAFDITGETLLEMRGEDRKGWLQGQVTNDVRSFTEGTSIKFCFCTPTGQMIADCTAWALSDCYLIATSSACAQAVLDRAEAMVIMEDVQMVDVTSGYRRISLQGPQASNETGAVSNLPSLDAGQTEGGTILLRNDRTGMGGWDLLMPGKNSEMDRLIGKVQRSGAEAVDIARIEAGIPCFGLDMNEKTLPPEMGPHYVSSHINYRKGCYTGQEVLMRIYSRGHTNRSWMGLILDGPARAGDIVRHRSREDAGVVTSAVDSPRFGFIATAMLRREVAEEGMEVEVATEGGIITAEAVQLPFLRLT